MEFEGFTIEVEQDDDDDFEEDLLKDKKDEDI